ncbi:hypothetical protein DFR51_0809 [Sphingosinicella microcystinivorans]|uniref:Uncharacterized protein n=1 Tax=Sphingosinicella microcystinivorans TaxID=335406 RepID=A0ABX9T1Q3_SPHMI|nr:hypothetical protein DFR51_0809 [Sphingosinicella microcystinivorans]
MRSHIEFRSSELLGAHDDGGAPQGQEVAKLLRSGLPERGFHVEGMSSEDWGWRVKISHPAFPLWIGCGFYPELEDGMLCFIEPSKPYVRRWLKRVSTTEVVELLASALESTLRKSGKAQDLRWWSEDEITRG